MEQIIKTLIYIHAFFGGVGLITGMISVFVKKGGINHKKAGKLFTYSMMSSALISLFVAKMPNHESTFLFLIGVYTIYLVLAGNRALSFKDKSKVDASLLDKALSAVMLLASVTMIVIGIVALIKNSNNGILYIFFGGIGLMNTLKDFYDFHTKAFAHNKNAWLTSHLGGMVGALIASITAFLVAGLNIGTTLVWITPTILGTIYIVWWNKKLKPKKAN
jgi:uncharacterized membrane protein